MIKQSTDIEIICDVLNGNTSSYALLVKRHQRFVFSLALRYVKSREIAEEIAQDTFVKAFKSIGTFKQESKFSTWLYRIVYTTSMTYLRKSNIEIQSIYDGEVLYEASQCSSSDRADYYDKKSTYAILNTVVNSLSVEDAQIVTLFYKGEQSLEEIAQILGTNSNQVKIKLHRARFKIKSKMQILLKDEINELL